MVQRYIREAELFIKNPLKQMGGLKMIYLDKRDRSRIAVICAVVFVAIIALKSGHPADSWARNPIRSSKLFVVQDRMHRVHHAALRC